MWQNKKYQFVSLRIYLYEDHLVWNEVAFAGREVTLYYTDIISVAGGNPIRILGFQDNSRFEINTAGQNYTYASPLGPFQGVEECMQIINERIQFFRNKNSTAASSAGLANRININPDNIEPTITRIELFLEDGDWDNVKAYANAALDYFPTDYRLYLFLLFEELKITSVDKLKSCDSSFVDNKYFKKLKRFADPETLEKLTEISKSKTEEERQKKERQQQAKANETRFSLMQIKREIENANTAPECTRILNRLNERRGELDLAEIIAEVERKRDFIKFDGTYNRLIEKLEEVNDPASAAKLSREFNILDGYKESKKYAKKAEEKSQALLMKKEEVKEKLTSQILGISKEIENLESELSKLGLFSRQKRNEIEESLRQKRAYKNQLVDEKNKWIETK